MKNSKSTARGVAKSLFIISFLFINAMAFGQDTLKAGVPLDFGKPYDFSLKNKWYYFKLNDTLTVKVVDHLRLPISLGFTEGSVTIVETQKGDVIRIIDPKNNFNSYRKGQTIKVAPANKPSTSSVSFALIENPDAKKAGSSGFDLAVQKTTWGSLLTN